MKITLVEMEGMIRGKCVPHNMLVNESLPEYLARQFDSLHERMESAERERDELRAEQVEHDEQIARMEGKFCLAKRALDSKTERCDKAEAELARLNAAAAGKALLLQEDFELWYQKYMGTPKNVLVTLRSGSGYRETEGDRLNISWFAYLHAAQAAVLPPEMLPENTLEIETLQGLKLSQMQRAIAADAYNQCRADALALGAQPQPVVELPDSFAIGENADGYFNDVVCLIDDVKTALDAAGVKWEVKK